MTYYEITIPAALAATKDATDARIVRYYSGTIAVTAGLAAKQDKVTSVQFSGHDGESAFEASIAATEIQKRLEQVFSVANQPVTFLPFGSQVWAGLAPGDQQVQCPIQIEFQVDGSVKVLVAPKWVRELQGKALRVACET